jgi:hypothetical protein
MVVVLVIGILIEEVRLNFHNPVKIKSAAIKQACSVEITSLRPHDAGGRVLERSLDG